MSKTIFCDRCGNKIEGGSYELRYTFRNTTWDLCTDCFKAFNEFMGNKPQEIKAIPSTSKEII